MAKISPITFITLTDYEAMIRESERLRIANEALVAEAQDLRKQHDEWAFGQVCEGFMATEPVIHDLRKDPTDVPSDTRTVIVAYTANRPPLRTQPAWCDRSVEGWMFLMGPAAAEENGRRVIAWQELPTFGDIS